MLDTALEGALIHAFNSPLTGITGTIDLFLDGTLGALTAEQKEYLESIRVSARTLADLINEWGIITDIDSGEFKLARSQVSISELLAEIMPPLISSAKKEEKNIEVRAAGNLSVSADRSLLGRVLGILIKNALKQVGRKGKVALKVNKVKDKISFEVDAAGVSADKALLPHLFEKDFKAAHYEQRAMTGPGLSFYFCRLIIEVHGGSIGAYAIPEGTSYRFTAS